MLTLIDFILIKLNQNVDMKINTEQLHTTLPKTKDASSLPWWGELKTMLITPSLLLAR